MPVEFVISMEVEGRDGSCTESVKTVSGDLVCVCVGGGVNTSTGCCPCITGSHHHVVLGCGERAYVIYTLSLC